jgi:hypothetical protein
VSSGRKVSARFTQSMLGLYLVACTDAARQGGAGGGSVEIGAFNRSRDDQGARRCACGGHGSNHGGAARIRTHQLACVRLGQPWPRRRRGARRGRATGGAARGGCAGQRARARRARDGERRLTIVNLEAHRAAAAVHASSRARRLKIAARSVGGGGYHLAGDCRPATVRSGVLAPAARLTIVASYLRCSHAVVVHVAG